MSNSRPTLLVKGSVIIVFGIFLAKGANSIKRFLIGRELGVEELGMFATVVALASMISSFSIAGITSAVSKFLSEYHAKGRERLMTGVLKTSLKSIAILLIPLISIAIPFRHYYLGNGFSPILILQGIILIPLMAFLAWQVSWLRGMKDAKSTIVLRDLTQHFSGILFIILFFFVFNIRNLQVVLWCIIGAFVLTNFFGVLILQRFHNILYYFKKEPELEIKTWFDFSWPLSLSVILKNSLGRSVDVLFVGFLSTQKEVGIYVAALSLAILLNIVLQGINFLALPIFSTVLAKEDRINVLRSVRKLIFGLTIPILLVLLFFPGVFIHFTYGDNFMEVAKVLPVLCVGFAFSNYSGPVGQMLQAEQKTKLHLVADLISVLIFLSVGLLLIPKYGALGAAVSTCLSLIGFNVIGLLAFYRNHINETIVVSLMYLVPIIWFILLYVIIQYFQIKDDVVLLIMILVFLSISYFTWLRTNKTLLNRT